MKKLILLLIPLVFLINANTVISAEQKWQEEEFCWQKPTAREDGTPLATDEIVEYQIWYNEDDHGVNWELKWTVPNTVGCVTYTPQGIGGEVCLNGFAIAVDNGDNADPTDTLMSNKSNQVCRFPKKVPVTSSPPMPPVFL